jgi:hypothetical protein
MRQLTRLPLVAALSLAGLIHASLTAAPAAVSTVDTAERSAHFDAVNRRLELGGTLYGYMDIDGDVAKLGDLVTGLAVEVAKLNPMASIARQDYTQIFSELGLSDIKAVGLSSVRDGAGFRNRLFIYTPGGRRGLLAITGGAAKRFENVRLAPADADVFAEQEIDVPAVYAALRQIVVRVGGEGLAENLERELMRPGQKGVSGHEVIQSLRGRYTLIVRVEPQNPIALPNDLSLPGVSFFIKADGVGDVLQRALADERELRTVNEGGRTMLEAPEPLPMTTIQPVIVFEGGACVVASSRAFAVECLDRRAGSLADQPAFQTALRSVGEEGNALTYVTPRVAAEVRAALDQVGKLQPTAAGMVQAVQRLLPDLDTPIISVRSNLADGILTKSYSYRSLKQEVLLGVNGPYVIGMWSAMAIPAFQKVRTNSQEKMIQNNLRQFNAAAQQHMLETGKTSASYADVVGPEQGKYIRELKPVDGEDYESLVLNAGDTELSVTTRSGKTVTLSVD